MVDNGTLRYWFGDHLCSAQSRLLNIEYGGLPSPEI